MAGAGDDVHVAVAKFFGRLADMADQRWVEGDGVEVADGFHRTADTEVFADFGRLFLDRSAHPVELVLVDGADIDGKGHGAGQHVAGVRLEHHLADAADCVWLGLHRDLLNHLQYARHRKSGIDTHRHRR